MNGSRDLCYCTTKDCPIKKNCKRNICNLTEEEYKQHLWLFTSSPGAYRNVNGKEVWICDKQLKIEK
jgi:hypothetical protein